MCGLTPQPDNPARAGLLRGTTGRLADYPWSSFPCFVRKAELPEWLVRDRVFASYELPDAGTGSRKRYESLMELRAVEARGGNPSEKLAEEWKAIRRGWYVGDDTFRDRLLELAARQASGRKRASYREEGLRLHDEREAIRLLAQAASRFGVSVSELWSRRQTDPVKQAVAWWVKSRSVVSDEWVSAKLEMGSRSNIHRAVKAYRAPRDRVRSRLKSELQLCADPIIF